MDSTQLRVECGLRVGLTADLQLIADHAAPGDLVVAYHLSGPYVRDRLLNSDDVAADVQVVDEARDQLVTAHLDDFIGNEVDNVWCVIPYEAGPEATDAACRADPATWTETSRTTMSRAAIVRLERREHALNTERPHLEEWIERRW